MTVSSSSRRSFMKLAAAAPLLSQLAARELYAQAASAVGKDPRQNIYTRLGVQTVINCRGTWTYLSGSIEFPEVRQAQLAAADYFVDVIDLQRAVGRRLSELTGAESGIVTSGSAGAMAAATAGCMAGTDEKQIWQLPDTTGLKNEVVMVGGRSAFDSAIRLTGAKLILAFSPEELTNAINQNTAMIYTTDLGEKLDANYRLRKTIKSQCCSMTRLASLPLATPSSTPRWASIFTASRAGRGSAGRNAVDCFWGGKISWKRP